MKLLIVRHAIAVPRGTPDIPDAERPLTGEGVRRFEAAARGLARLFDRPDVLLASPWRRAWDTALLAAEAWGKVKPRRTPELASDDSDALADVLDAHRAAGLVAVVGHEPWLSELLGRLLGSPHPDRLELKKGGAALLEVPEGIRQGGRLLSYLPPKVLRRLGE
jgi:phosphohistidine phosphatase